MQKLLSVQCTALSLGNIISSDFDVTAYIKLGEGGNFLIKFFLIKLLWLKCRQHGLNAGSKGCPSYRLYDCGQEKKTILS